MGEELNVMIRDSVDSGMGSPSLKSSWSRGWGRRCNRRAELQKLELIKEALQELSESYGAEIKLMYNPRSHPNLKSLNLNRTVLAFPVRELEPGLAPARWTYQPGFFIQRAGITKTDVLENRLPNIPEGGHCIISNGLAIDLYRMAENDEKLMPAVIKFIFTFLELKFPDPVIARAVELTQNHIKNNMDYMQGCSKKEIARFMFSPVEVPAEVCEMASLLEDSEETLMSSLDSLFPSVCGPLPPGAVNFIDQNNMLCTLGIVENPISSETTFPEPHTTVPEPEMTSPVIHPGQRKSLEAVSKEQDPGGSQDDATCQEQTLQVVWSDENQENYQIIETENEMFSVTAAVYTPQAELTADSTVESADINCQIDQSDVFHAAALNESSAGCLVEEDTGSEPSEYQQTKSEHQTHQHTKSEKSKTKISRLAKRKRLDCSSKENLEGESESTPTENVESHESKRSSRVRSVPAKLKDFQI